MDLERVAQAIILFLIILCSIGFLFTFRDKKEPYKKKEDKDYSRYKAKLKPVDKKRVVIRRTDITTIDKENDL
jgi:hypothetical protein